MRAIRAYVTDEELRAVRRDAGAAGLSMSNYMRQLAGLPPTNTPGHPRGKRRAPTSTSPAPPAPPAPAPAPARQPRQAPGSATETDDGMISF